jgi:uncharacterized protein (DUF1499 family)
MSVTQCGEKPNCVSSKDKRSDFKIEPFKSDDPKTLLNELVEKISKLPRVKLVKHDKDKSAHFVFTTLIMRFKDDVYLETNNDAGQVEVMSRSRVGYSDLGKNRERVESLRALLKN